MNDKNATRASWIALILAVILGIAIGFGPRLYKTLSTPQPTVLAPQD